MKLLSAVLLLLALNVGAGETCEDLYAEAAAILERIAEECPCEDADTCEPEPCEEGQDCYIFADGFESGDLSAWSRALP